MTKRETPLKYLLVLLPVLMIGCGSSYYTVSIANYSSKTVAYSYNGSSDILGPDYMKKYRVEAYTPYPDNISTVPSGPVSVTLIRKNDLYVFEDVSPIILHVVNTLPFELTLTADSYIDNGGSTIVTLKEFESLDAEIYTSNPKFTLNSDFPIDFVKIEKRIEKDDIYVTIK
ncbi:putative lipoprotein [Treponema primitia ZAS-2]|uniref:Putative lipoprotein n=1 Tax=Treponema primitia (strain ATCC BAA-887 / DSM 12427 / ZAS-2) TaxID=545694 RepID=F5YR48_TREPZ|nr:hypothetical protein [Treponema primitia]AEF86100.1 putative lipoprotein [Treponema primitia ZAS-2]